MTMIASARRAVAVAALTISYRPSQAFSVIQKSSLHHGIFRATRTFLRMTKHAAVPPQVSISDAFDGGNILVSSIEREKENKVKIILNIKHDPFTALEEVEHFQHFYFRAAVQIDDTPLTATYVIDNADKASYGDAWNGYTVFHSKAPSDPNSWTRLVDSTEYKDGKLTWNYTHRMNESVYFAYFPPYSYERHLKLIQKCNDSERGTVCSLGQTLDGRELEVITAGSGNVTCWFIHRQHPGENMAEFYAEGLLERLLGLKMNGSVDGVTADVLSKYTFFLVPNMNPDGAIRGYLRTNACGANLNREWCPTEDYVAPSLERSPEVYHVLRAMDETGVDVFLDVHGDEALPFNFIAGSEGLSNFEPRLKSLQGAFLAAYCRANSDMQKEISYKPEETGKGRLNTCSNQIANRFDCLSVTLEMPFKDCVSNPDPKRGWNPARAKMLGASVLDALLYVHRYLRDETEFWNDLPEEDAYVRPTDQYQ